VSDAKVKQLKNLLSRGRQLHWANAAKLARAQLRTRLPERPPPLADLVYMAVQLLMATDFIERRGYLQGAALDRFGAQLFASVAGEHLGRVHGLVSNYAGAFDDEDAFVGTVCRDLSHAMFGASTPERIEALSGTPRAMLKTTHLYCAQTFRDAEVIRRLS
jgi:hypothetical protein